MESETVTRMTVTSVTFVKRPTYHHGNGIVATYNPRINLITGGSYTINTHYGNINNTMSIYCTRKTGNK